MMEPHKHCPICQTPIPLEETTCSAKCQSVLDSRQTQLNKGKIIVYVIMVIFLAIGAFMFLRGNNLL